MVSDPIRVTYLLKGWGRTGGSLVLYRFMEELVRRGYVVSAVTPDGSTEWHPGAELRALERATAPGGIVSRAARTVINRLPKAERAALKILTHRSHDPFREFATTTQRLLSHWTASDVTVATHWSTAFAAFSLGAQTTPVYHMQHLEELVEDSRAARSLAKATYFLPLQLIANSEWLVHQVRSRSGRTPNLLNPGIDTHIFSPGADWHHRYNQMLPLAVVSYCSPVPFKAWDVAEEAMRRVHRTLGPRAVRWKVYGSPPAQTDVPLEYVGRLFGPDLAALYRDAHVTFMSSWYESFPLPPIEAMACGSSVVTTRFGTEDYAVHEENSLVVPPQDPEALANAIVRLAVTPGLAMGLAEHALADVAHFDWTKSVDVLEEVISSARAHHDISVFRDEYGWAAQSSPED